MSGDGYGYTSSRPRCHGFGDHREEAAVADMLMRLTRFDQAGTASGGRRDNGSRSPSDCCRWSGSSRGRGSDSGSATCAGTAAWRRWSVLPGHSGARSEMWRQLWTNEARPLLFGSLLTGNDNTSIRRGHWSVGGTHTSAQVRGQRSRLSTRCVRTAGTSCR